MSRHGVIYFHSISLWLLKLIHRKGCTLTGGLKTWYEKIFKKIFQTSTLTVFKQSKFPKGEYFKIVVTGVLTSCRFVTPTQTKTTP